MDGDELLFADVLTEESFKVDHHSVELQQVFQQGLQRLKLLAPRATCFVFKSVAPRITGPANVW